MCPPNTTSRAGPVPSEDVAAELSGDLTCARCGYNLRGLSIRSSCPECGLAVGATIQMVVDPHADKLRPVRWPRLTAWLLLVWAGGAMLAVLLVAVMRGQDVAATILGRTIDHGLLPVVATGALAMSAIGTLALVRPLADLTWKRTVLAAVGVLAAAFAVVCFQSVMSIDRVMPNPFASTPPRGSPRPLASVCVVLAGVLWLLAVRVNYRALLTRSFAMRTGRVDRQRLTPLIAALLVVAVGDALLIVYQRFEVVDVLPFIAVAVIGLGSVLLAVGLANLTVDVVRLRPALIARSKSMRDILPDHAHGADTEPTA